MADSPPANEEKEAYFELLFLRPCALLFHLPSRDPVEWRQTYLLHGATYDFEGYALCAMHVGEHHVNDKSGSRLNC